MNNIVYIGVFLDDSNTLLDWFETLAPLHERTHAHHMTCAFRPDGEEGFEIGTRVELEVVGWAKDECGQAPIKPSLE